MSSPAPCKPSQHSRRGSISCWGAIPCWSIDSGALLQDVADAEAAAPRLRRGAQRQAKAAAQAAAQAAAAGACLPCMHLGVHAESLCKTHCKLRLQIAFQLPAIIIFYDARHIF